MIPWILSKWPYRLLLASAASTGALLLPHHPDDVRWSGRQCLLSGTFAPATGAAEVGLDLDGDGSPDLWRALERDGSYVVAIAAERIATEAIRAVARDKNGRPVGAESFSLNRLAEEDMANALVESGGEGVPTSACGCNSSGVGTALDVTSTLTSSREAAFEGVSLADGTLLTRLPVFDFATVGHQVRFELLHRSLTTYAGPVGTSMSHSYNSFVVQDDATTGRFVTPDLRVFPIHSVNGTDWDLPEGFLATLQRDAATGQWLMTYPNGEAYTFILGAPGLPGNLRAITDTNGNRLSFSYDASGRLIRITTPVGQNTVLAYDTGGRLQAITDPLSRRWTFTYSSGRLAAITSPITEVTSQAVTTSTTGDGLAGSLVNRSITRSLVYQNTTFPSHLTRLVNGLGQTMASVRYDSAGRVAGRSLGNGPEATFQYDDALFDGLAMLRPGVSPVPRSKLDAGNRTTRVVDRVGNTIDVETHGPAGGPLGGAGKLGVRRVVQWTERGLGHSPLRSDEPDAHERRWLHDSDNLSPLKVSDSFRSDQALSFDANGMPLAWPVESFTYNAWRQVTEALLSDGTQSRRWTRTYQDFSPAQGQFTRLLSATAPRAFSGSSLDAGLAFTTTFTYDSLGNLTHVVHPVATRGVSQPQAAEEDYVRNARGQIVAYRDSAGDITTMEYFTSSQTSSNINHQGQWTGYLAAVTHGATGSTNPVVNAREAYAVNNLGMVTKTTDPAGGVWTVEYTTLGQVTRNTSPAVALGATNASLVTRNHYDAAGQPSLLRERNFDHDGQLRPNAWIDTVFGRDGRGNLTSIRREVDADPGHDVVTRYAYDANDTAIAVMQPAGNRLFRTFDERQLPLRQFGGLEPPTNGDPLQGYPLRSTTALAGALTSRENAYDAAGSLVREVDGLGHVTTHFFDFAHREVATRDPNGNGARYEYDQAGNLVTESRGMVAVDGSLTSVLKRTYGRYDERSRRYELVVDGDLATDESGNVVPGVAASARSAWTFGPGGQMLAETDPMGRTRSHTYDALGKPVGVVDAVGNSVQFVRNALGLATEIRANEVDAFAPGVSSVAFGTAQYDALGRVVQLTFEGKANDPHHLVERFAYDATGFCRVRVDAEGRSEERERDDLQREIVWRQRDASGAELARNTKTWDVDSRLIAETDLADVADANSARTKRYGWDTLDREVRRVDTDADDPTSGIGNGADGIRDRIDWTWDANSNIVAMTDERGFTKTATFDAGGRRTGSRVTTDNGPAPGVAAEHFVYDSLDRVIEKANDFVRCQIAYSALGSILGETQSVRLDGSGFTRGFIDPVTMSRSYDRVGNETGATVASAAGVDLQLTRSFDRLDRITNIAASYANGSRSHTVASFAYEGKDRLRRITYGNGAQWNGTFDGAGRLSSSVWTSASEVLLVGSEYAYDSVGNPLWQRLLHDSGKTDSYRYDARNQLTGAIYRGAQPVDYRSQTTAWGSTWTYDDRTNRTASVETDAFGGLTLGGSATYTINSGNQMTQVVRSGGTQDLLYDRFGSALKMPVYPRNGASAGTASSADATYDVHAQMVSLLVDGQLVRYYYDTDHRQVARIRDTGGQVEDGVRWILLGGEQVVERQLAPGIAIGDAASSFHAVHVPGIRPDQPLFTAIDGDGDGRITDIDANPYAERAAVDRDHAFYHLHGNVGSVVALSQGDDSERVLEYYSYTAFGEATVLPAIDDNADGREDSPDDLSDNYVRMLDERTSQGDESLGRWSRYGNDRLFAGCRVDAESGQVNMRMRQYDPVLGRFTSRDWAEEVAPGHHPYSYVGNQPTAYTDPTGMIGAKFAWAFTTQFSLIATLRCPEEQKGRVTVAGVGSASVNRIPLIWGLTLDISLAAQLSASGEAQRCTAPPCMQVYGEFAVSVGLVATASAGWGAGDPGDGGSFRLEAGVSGALTGQGTYDPCAGKMRLKVTGSLTVFARLQIELGWWTSYRGVEFEVASGELITPATYDAPKFDCTPCPCCPPPQASAPRGTPGGGGRGGTTPGGGGGGGTTPGGGGGGGTTPGGGGGGGTTPGGSGSGPGSGYRPGGMGRRAASEPWGVGVVTGAGGRRDESELMSVLCGECCR